MTVTWASELCHKTHNPLIYSAGFTQDPRPYFTMQISHYWLHHPPCQLLSKLPEHLSQRTWQSASCSPTYHPPREGISLCSAAGYMSSDCENTTSVHVSGVGMVRNGHKVTSRSKQQTVKFKVLMVAGCNRKQGGAGGWGGGGEGKCILHLEEVSYARTLTSKHLL